MGEDLFKSTPTTAESPAMRQTPIMEAPVTQAPVMETPIAQTPVTEAHIKTITPDTNIQDDNDINISPALDNVFKNNNKTLDNLNLDDFYQDEVKAPVVETPETIEPVKDIVANDFATNNVADTSVDSVKLFVTKTCPNCKKAEELLDMAGIPYSIVDANENPDECEKYQIMQAPTLIVNDSVKYVNLSNVIKFVEQTTLTTQ